MHYTYLIGWSALNKFYYGARWARNCSPDDLWISYFTSSKHVASFRKEFGEPDIIQIRKLFDDPEKCRVHENKVLKRLHVLTDDKWLNRNINGRFLPYGPQTTEHVTKRVTKGIETRRKNGTLGMRPWSKDTHPNASKKISLAQKGRAKSQQHIASMRNRPQDTTMPSCPHCGKTGDYKNMKRWHMDRCRLNPNRITDKDPKPVTCVICGYAAMQSPNFYRNHGSNCRHVQSD